MTHHTEVLRVRATGPVATLELSRPAHRNALDRQMIDQLSAAVAELATADEIRVVVLTGAGGSFSAGADLIAFDIDNLGANMANFNTILLALRALPQPVIAKVRGAAVGAGCNLALSCDFVIADDTARFIQGFSRLGLSVDLGGSWFLPRLVGLRQARELALLGDDIDAATAARTGLINQCVAADALDRTVADLAARLTGHSRQAQARTKHLLDATWTGDLADALAREVDAQLANVNTSEFRAALARFQTRPTDADRATSAAARLPAEDLPLGEELDCGTHHVTEQEMLAFAAQWDPQYFHIDPVLAASSDFGGLIASGLHTLSIYQRLAVTAVYSRYDVIAGREMQRVKFIRPVRAGDTLTCRATVLAVEPDVPGRSSVTIEGQLHNQYGKPVLDLEVDCLIRSRPSG